MRGIHLPVTEAFVVFLVGLSGSGKTTVASWMEEDLGFIHLDIDPPAGRDGVNVSDIRQEWDLFLHQQEATPLAKAIRARVSEASASGAVLSFPSTALFHRPMIDLAEGVGIQTIILHGSPEQCRAAFLDREKSTGRRYTADHWHRNNDRAAALYLSAEYSDARMPAFRTDGTRWSREEMMQMVRERSRLAASGAPPSA
jgi:adenylate kinase family enzyme